MQTSGDDKIKILYMIDALALAGTEKQLIELITRLDREKFEPYLCSLQPVPDIFQINCEVIELNVQALFRLGTLRGLTSLIRFVRDRRIDIIQSYFIKENVLNVLAGRITRRPSVIAQRDLGHEQDSVVDSLMTAVTNRFAHLFWANSMMVKEWLIHSKKIPPRKIHLIYNGVDIKRFSPCGYEEKRLARRKIGLPEETFTIGIVANLKPVKGIEYFLEAVSLVCMEQPNVHFLIVGDGPIRTQLEVITDELKIREKVTFAGSVSDVLPYLSTMDIGVLSSLSEGFSNAILEYLAMGIPVIATDVGGNKEVVLDGKTGFLVPVRDSVAIAKSILQFVRDRNLICQMGLSARKIIEENFSLERMISDYEKVYITLVDHML